LLNDCHGVALLNSYLLAAAIVLDCKRAIC